MLVVQQVEQCLSSNSLETRDYLRAIERLNSTGLGFEDVEMFLFRLEVNVLLNLVGLHHCMHRLEVPAEHVMEALQNSKISQRQVCIKWWTPRRLLPRPRMRDGSDHTDHGSIALTHAGNLFRSHVVSLQDLGLPQAIETLSILRRGANDEVSCV